MVHLCAKFIPLHIKDVIRGTYNVTVSQRRHICKSKRLPITSSQYPWNSGNNLVLKIQSSLLGSDAMSLHESSSSWSLFILDCFTPKMKSLNHSKGMEILVHRHKVKSQKITSLWETEISRSYNVCYGTLSAISHHGNVHNNLTTEMSITISRSRRPFSHL